MQTYILHRDQAKKAVFIMSEILTTTNVMSENIKHVIKEAGNNDMVASDINVSNKLLESIEDRMGIFDNVQ